MRNKLFLSHYSRDAADIALWATELRLRGIVPWVDKDDGFSVGDHSEQEARRAIREDCLGFALYAAPGVFDRPFIRRVEMDEARKVKEADPSFVLFTLLRGVSFDDLRMQSKRKFRIDLSAFHSESVPVGPLQQADFSHVAASVLPLVLRRLGATERDRLSLQFSTRQLMPAEPNDALNINAVPILCDRPGDFASWSALLGGLRDAQREISRILGRPRLYIHGSKHLTAAFMFGRVFGRFDMDIRQTATTVWASDVPPCAGDAFRASTRRYRAKGARLFVEVSSRGKPIAEGVEAYIARSGVQPSVRLQLEPLGEPLDIDSAALCRSMVDQTYREIERVMREQMATEIHIFSAVPQAYMMMLGKAFAGMPSVHLYEWTGTQYVPSCVLPGGVL